MLNLKEKIHALVDNTHDPIVLENAFNYLSSVSGNRKKDILDELSPEDLRLLEEAQAEYRRGESIPHEEVLEMLRKWREK